MRKWVRRAQIDDGQRPGTTSDELAELKRLRRENAELKRANEILKAASAFRRRAGSDVSYSFFGNSSVATGPEAAKAKQRKTLSNAPRAAAPTAPGPPAKSCECPG